MTHPLIEKILAALANSSSTNYVDESILLALGRKLGINLALDDLLGERTIVTCLITKCGRTYSVYWLAQQFDKPIHYSEIFTPEKRLERAAAKKTKTTENKTERPCKLCLVTKPINAYKGRATRCEQCMKALRAEKYKLLTSQAKETTPTRWCMACKKSHPDTEFGNTRSRRCTASMLIYKQNERAIRTRKQSEWRAKVKAAQAVAPCQSA